MAWALTLACTAQTMQHEAFPLEDIEAATTSPDVLDYVDKFTVRLPRHQEL